MRFRWSFIGLIGVVLVGTLFVSAFVARGGSQNRAGTIQTLRAGQAQNLTDSLEGSFLGFVQLERVGAGVYTDSLPTATPAPGVTPIPTPALGRIDLGLMLSQSGAGVTGFVDLDTTLVFTKEATILVTPVGTPPGPGTPVPTPSPLDAGPAVTGLLDGSNLVLTSAIVSQTIAGQRVDRQFRLTGVVTSDATGILFSGEYRETLWGVAPQPLTLIGRFELIQPIFVSAAVEMPTVTSTSTPTSTPGAATSTSTTTATATTVAENTATPTPTATTVPENTATSTATTVPASTATSTPTATTVPANTATSTPTATTVPANTVTSTPTATVVPANTATSTPTVTPTLQPDGATVTGIVYDDKNGSGSQDEGEPGVVDAQVTLSDETRSASLTRTVSTNGQGIYTFADVPVGQYSLHVVLPAGQSSANPSPIMVNVASGDPVTVPSVAVQTQTKIYLPSVQR
jgi:hypothetical protein